MPRSASSQSLDPVSADALIEHAGVAFTDAVNVAMAVSAVISLIAGAMVLYAGRESVRRAVRPMSGPPDVDPRIERSRAVILEATLDELADVGYGAFTVEGVARRAGVSKATVYRHWDGKLELVADAVALLKQIGPAARHRRPPGTHRRHAARHRRAARQTRRFAACVPAVVSAAERDPALRAFTTGRAPNAGPSWSDCSTRPATPGTSIPMSTPACWPSCSWPRSSSGG